MTNKTTNETTNQTGNNSNSLVAMVFDNANQAPLQSQQLQRAAPLTTATNKSSKEKRNHLKLRNNAE